MPHTNPLLSRRKELKVSVEVATTKGTLVAGATVVTVYDLVIEPTSEFIQRDPHATSCGHGDGALGPLLGRCTFSTELRGNLTGAIDVGLAVLLQGCGMTGTTAHVPVSSPATQLSITLYAYIDGDLHALSGAMGTFTLSGTAGQRMMLDFEFQGVWVTVATASIPGSTYTAALPTLLRGSAFSVGALSPIVNTFSLAMNNVVVPREDVTSTTGIPHFIIADRDPVITIDPEAELVANNEAYDIWTAVTENAVSITLINTETTFTLTAPKAQITSITNGDRGGKKIHNMTLQCNTSGVSGDDDVSLATAAT